MSKINVPVRSSFTCELLKAFPCPLCTMSLSGARLIGWLEERVLRLLPSDFASSQRRPSHAFLLLASLCFGDETALHSCLKPSDRCAVKHVRYCSSFHSSCIEIGSESTDKFVICERLTRDKRDHPALDLSHEENDTCESLDCRCE